MAIGGYSWEEAGRDPAMIEGMDPEHFGTFFTIRMEFEGGQCIGVTPVHPQTVVPIAVIDLKLALLKAAPAQTRVPGVGWRRSETLFYLHIYETDLPLGEIK